MQSYHIIGAVQNSHLDPACFLSHSLGRICKKNRHGVMIKNPSSLGPQSQPTASPWNASSLAEVDLLRALTRTGVPAVDLEALVRAGDFWCGLRFVEEKVKRVFKSFYVVV